MGLENEAAQSGIRGTSPDSSGTPEFWFLSSPRPTITVGLAERAEKEGWDGMLLTDANSRSCDPYIMLGLASLSTNRLQLGTGVTNPVSRHPAVTASCIATIQALSDGRAVLGIGRGDSSLANLGMAPAPPQLFARCLKQLQTYLKGETISLKDLVDPSRELASLGSLHLASAPSTSQLEWLPSSTVRKVPVDVSATGPRMISIGANLAERVTLAVGAEPKRISWAISSARKSIERKTTQEASPSLGAYINVVVHPNSKQARRLVASSVALFARFSVMHGRPQGPFSKQDLEVLGGIRSSYEMTSHGKPDSAQVRMLTDDFIDRFAIAGDPAYCRDRLQELAAIGIDRFVLLGGVPGGVLFGHQEEADEAAQRFVKDVLPHFR
jgi:5,10-methylenetetrahydromethanopterin reductase